MSQARGLQSFSDSTTVGIAMHSAFAKSMPQGVSQTDFVEDFGEPSREEDWVALMNGTSVLIEGEFSQLPGFSIEHLL